MQDARSSGAPRTRRVGSSKRSGSKRNTADDAVAHAHKGMLTSIAGDPTSEDPSLSPPLSQHEGQQHLLRCVIAQVAKSYSASAKGSPVMKAAATCASRKSAVSWPVRKPISSDTSNRAALPTPPRGQEGLTFRVHTPVRRPPDSEGGGIERMSVLGNVGLVAWVGT